jgi:hypothetical protein
MSFTKIRSAISELSFTSRSVPFVLLFLTVIGFGLLIPFLGYYFDDWPVIWLIKTEANFWDFYIYDRPFSAWTYLVTTPFLGTTPWHWHVFTLILRWLTTCLFWWVLKIIWPDQLKLVTWSALLFAVYPAFFQQSVAVAYSQHFTTYIFFLLSLGFMVIALRKHRFHWGWITLSITSQAIHLFTMEYFWGLELIRPIMIWIVLSEDIYQRKQRFLATLKNWFPYLLIYFSAIFWRVFIYQPPIEDPNALAWLDLLFRDPFAAFIRLIEIVLRDVISVMLVTWNRTLQTDTITFNTVFSVGVWIVIIVSVISVYIYIKSFRSDDLNGSPSPKRRKHFIFLGLWGILCGFVPIWLTNRESVVGMYADRFALAGIFGASILMVGILDYLLADAFKKRLILSLLVGLAVGLHLRVANDYRWDWIRQQRFYWQFHWRVPALEPNTAIFSEGTLFGFLGDYPTSFALNVLNLEKHYSEEPAYWFFELDDKFIRFTRKYLNGNELNDSLRNVAFEGWSLDSIVLDYDSYSGSCLWIVETGDELVFALPELTRMAIPMSDMERIITDESALEFSIPEEIFGEEPHPDWCYYFQKASTARQIEDWDEIQMIKADVDRDGYKPQNPFEWIPFIDAYLQLGNWRDAQELTIRAYTADPETAAALCYMWEQALNEYPDTISEQDLDTVYDQLSCYQYQR